MGELDARSSARCAMVVFFGDEGNEGGLTLI